MYSLNVAKDESGMPMTAVRFRPHSSASKTKNVLLAVNSDGSVQHWHITSGKCLHKIEDENNQLYTVDYRKDARIFVTAGKDYKVRIYDEATKTLTTTLCRGFGKVTPGHSNRVFSLKFNPDDDNVVVSGGWDNTVQVWDLRVEHSVRSFYGPHICGDAVDIHNNTVLTGSWRPENQVELWDLGSGKLIENVPWHQSSIHGEHCAIYAAQFSKYDNARFIGAGGSGANETKIFDRKRKNKCIGTVTGLTRGVFSLDFDPCSSRVSTEKKKKQGSSFYNVNRALFPAFFLFLFTTSRCLFCFPSCSSSSSLPFFLIFLLQLPQMVIAGGDASIRVYDVAVSESGAIKENLIPSQSNA